MITGHLPELMLVLVLGLIIFGPKRLPEIGEAMGKGIRSFKSGVAHISDDMPADNQVEHAASPLPATRAASSQPGEPVPASELHVASTH